MDAKFIRAATMPRYGSTLYVGIGIPIPVLNEKIAERCAIRDEDIEVPIYDYGVPRRDKPLIAKTNYKVLRNGKITLRVEIDGKEIEKTVKTGSVSSYKMAREVAETLKQWILDGRFLLTERVALLGRAENKPMKSPITLVKDILSKPPITAPSNVSIMDAAKIMIEHNINHLPIVDECGKLLGIITSWDIAKALAQNKKTIEEIMTRNVITAHEDEPVDHVARKMGKYNISGLPVVNDNRKLVGMITSEDISRLFGGKK